MIEPPGQLRRRRVLEVYNGVFVAIENFPFKRLRGAVNHSAVAEFGILPDAFAIETRKDSGGSSAVEAFVVKANADFHPGNRPPREKNCAQNKANKDGWEEKKSQAFVLGGSVKHIV